MENNIIKKADNKRKIMKTILPKFFHYRVQDSGNDGLLQQSIFLALGVPEFYQLYLFNFNK